MCADVKPLLETSELAAAAESAAESGDVFRSHKVREHKRVYRCTLCNKVFQNSSNLNRHIRSHGIYPILWSGEHAITSEIELKSTRGQ